MFERFGDGLVGVAGGSRELCDDDTGGGGGDVCAVCMETISVVDATGQQGSSIPYHYFIPSSFSFSFHSLPLWTRGCRAAGRVCRELYGDGLNQTSQTSVARSLNRQTRTHRDGNCDAGRGLQKKEIYRDGRARGANDPFNRGANNPLNVRRSCRLDPVAEGRTARRRRDGFTVPTPVSPGVPRAVAGRCAKQAS